MKNKLIAIFMAITFCFLSSFCFCSVGFSSEVHAADSFSLPDKYWSNFAFDYTYPDGINYENFCDDFFSYSGLNASDYFLIIATGTAVYESGRMYIYPYERDAVVTAYSDSSHRYLYLKSYPTTIYYCNDSTLSSFGSMSYSQFSIYPRSFCYDNTNNVYRQCVLETNGTWRSLEYNDIPVSVINETVPTFNPPDGYLTGVIVGFDFSVDAFYNWLIDTGKYLELPNYIGTAKLKSFLQFYKEWGGSNNIFVDKIVSWLDYFNIVSQTVENRNILKTTIDNLYREYRSQAFVTIKPQYNNNIHHRRDIVTVTDDDNTTLITDDSSDDLSISILRDILRGIIYIPTAIFNSTELLIDKFDNLSYDVIVSNNGGSSDLSILYNYDSNDFEDDFYTFEENVSDITAVPLSYVQTINNNSLMPENMLSDKQSLTVTIPVINGFTVNNDGTQYETNTDTYTLNSTDYPWLDTIVKKMKRFASIMLIIGYLIHLRFKIADIVRGE